MKFGKRRQETEVPGVTLPTSGTTGPGRRRDGGESTSPPAVTDSWTVPAAEPQPAEPLIYADPVVEGDAVELPAAESATSTYEPPLPPALQGTAVAPDRVAEQPVTVAGSASGPRPAPVSSLAGSGEAFASGHAAAPGPSWQEPLMELANERPEVVVGAAFAGGVLAAMILRRLGN